MFTITIPTTDIEACYRVTEIIRAAVKGHQHDLQVSGFDVHLYCDAAVAAMAMLKIDPADVIFA